MLTKKVSCTHNVTLTGGLPFWFEFLFFKRFWPFPWGFQNNHIWDDLKNYINLSWAYIKYWWIFMSCHEKRNFSHVLTSLYPDPVFTKLPTLDNGPALNKSVSLLSVGWLEPRHMWTLMTLHCEDCEFLLYGIGEAPQQFIIKTKVFLLRASWCLNSNEMCHSCHKRWKLLSKIHFRNTWSKMAL